MTEFAVRSPDYVKLGLDPRWLFPDDGLQRAMLSEHLGASASSDFLEDVQDFTRVARVLAIARTMGGELSGLFQEARMGEQQRRKLEEIIGLLSGRSASTARRLLRGMNVFEETERGTLLHRTDELAEIVLRRDQGRAKLSLDVELLMSLCLASGREVRELVPTVERYAANAAAALLRIRVEGRGSEIEFAAVLRVMQEYPSLRGQLEVKEGVSAVEAEGFRRMRVYGSYMSIAARHYFSSFPPEVGEGFVEVATGETMGELLRSGAGEYSRTEVWGYLEDVGGKVGRAMCGVDGFGRRPDRGLGNV
jgi:hypothetical protein